MSDSNRLRFALFRRVDAASLAVVRIAFGAVMLWEIGRYWSHGWIRSYYAVPKFFFTYPFFEWVHPLSGRLLAAHFDVLALAAICIVLGLFTRIAAAVFAVGFSWWFLSDQTHYLNHFYLIALISLLLVFVPTDGAFSLDAHFRPRRDDRGTAPGWALWLMRFQIGVPYFFGGIAKLNADWLAGEPIRDWLTHARDVPILGAYCTEEWCVWMFAWGGLLLDLLLVPALLWKRTRVPAYLAALSFHGLNAVVFSIGIFPWMMIAATTIFFEPDWPRSLPFLRRRPELALASSPPPLTTTRRVGLVALAAWVAFQCLFPLRHFLYPGNVSWTEEGHRFSWHMKLRDKDGSARFFARDPATGRSWEIDPLEYLTKKQAREMVGHPEMLLQFARHVSHQSEEQGKGRLEVRAQVMVSLNGRAAQLMIDPGVDLAAQPRTVGRWDWILPLTEPLRAR